MNKSKKRRLEKQQYRLTAVNNVTRLVQDSDSGDVMTATQFKRVKRLARGVATDRLYGNPGKVRGDELLIT